MGETLREKASALPSLPGVYIMMDKSGEVIYVGKALSLKNRVSSYFHGAHNAKTEIMVSKVARFDVIVVGSEFEALVLENQLIKRHMPKYNIKLRDDKGHPYIRTDMRLEYPEFTVVSKRGSDGARYLGPYGSRSTAHGAISAVLKTFKLPTCSRKFPRDIGRERPCLNRDMGICRGWCVPGTPQSDYREAVNAAVLIFDGKGDDLAASLNAEMEQAAESLQFETAASLRDMLRAVSDLKRRQHVVSASRADVDVVGYYKGAAKSCFTVLHYIDGVLLEKDSELFDAPLEDDGEAISAVLRQYYLRRDVYPREVLLPFLPDDSEALQEMLSSEAGHRVTLTVPQRGDKRKLTDNAAVNAREEAERAATREEKIRKTIEWLGKAMGLDTPPVRMEAFDVSNTGDENIAASMTVFENGKPKKNSYRKFKIRSTDGQDDYRSMAEAVTRRANRFLEGDAGFTPLPDVILIDGGENHARFAENALRGLGILTPVFGMVKDARHRTRALVAPDGREVGIEGYPSAFALIGTIQEETHRFAIEYQRSLQGKNVKKSKLDEIPGIGEKRRQTLLKSFGTLTAIKEADVEALSKVVPKNAAEKTYAFFHAQEITEPEKEITEEEE